MVNIYFSNVFQIDEEILDEYGALNISLINDIPLFIDPFLLFQSEKTEYQKLHNEIIEYLKFLRDKSLEGEIRKGLLNHWFKFPEVKQNWLGFSTTGNSGHGLSEKFAISLNKNLKHIFKNFSDEEIAKSSHLETLCLIEDGVGIDLISDFTTNLIMEYLLEYTQSFAQKYLKPTQTRKLPIRKVKFDYKTERWGKKYYTLPFHNNDFVILTPKDLLTQDEMWINKSDFYDQYFDIVKSIPNEELRDQLNNYLMKILPEDEKPKKSDLNMAINQIIRDNPKVLEYFIKIKEMEGGKALEKNEKTLSEVQTLFIDQVLNLTEPLLKFTKFYETPWGWDTYDETLLRIEYLKDYIENKGGYKIFYPNSKPIKKETTIKILFRLVWYGTPSDVSMEVNDGMGPADAKVSRGANDKTLVEFKLASNTQLKRNLLNQLEIYKKASDAKQGIKVIVYFSPEEKQKVNKILGEIGLSKGKNIILIDADDSNKPTGSKA